MPNRIEPRRQAAAKLLIRRIILPTGTRPPIFPHEDDDDHSPAEIEHLTQLARTRTTTLTAA